MQIKPILGIDKATVEKIFKTLFIFVTGSENGFSGSLGIQKDAYSKVLSVGRAGSNETIELEQYFNMVTIEGIEGSPFLPAGTPHAITAVSIGDICVASSCIGGVWNKAVAVLYGIFHKEWSRERGIIHDGVIDTILLHAGEWDKQYFPNKELLLLAQKTFKPEIVAVLQ